MPHMEIDRFPVDIQHYAGTEQAWAVCEGCGCDIYDDAIEMPDGGLVHDDMECITKYPGVKRRVG